MNSIGSSHDSVETAALQVRPVAPPIFSRSGPGAATARATRAYDPVTASAPERAQERISLWITGLGDVRGPRPQGRAPGSNLPVMAAVRVLFDDTSVIPIESYAATGFAGFYHVTVAIPPMNAGMVAVRAMANGVPNNALPIPMD